LAIPAQIQQSSGPKRTGNPNNARSATRGGGVALELGEGLRDLAFGCVQLRQREERLGLCVVQFQGGIRALSCPFPIALRQSQQGAHTVGIGVSWCLLEDRIQILFGFDRVGAEGVQPGAQHNKTGVIRYRSQALLHFPAGGISIAFAQCCFRLLETFFCRGVFFTMGFQCFYGFGPGIRHRV